MKKLLASIVAAGVLVSGAFVASTVTGTSAEAQTTEETVIDKPVRPERGAILGEVLDKLVRDEVIDSSQADAVKEALTEAFLTNRERMKERSGDRGPGFRKARRGLLRGLLADGVISADEIAALPDDHPLRNGEGPLAELLEDDGQITRAELDAFIQQRRAERREARGLDG
ncbi:MAG: hypothetical protein BMS9Abin20_0373 [Acidimicrobiia bacterium]|nr:MAG: hypothetical protein BMS9Abin20_0373 [Acidimicrobiia bacterium]